MFGEAAEGEGKKDEEHKLVKKEWRKEKMDGEGDKEEGKENKDKNNNRK